jgi:hypothetical protein
MGSGGMFGAARGGRRFAYYTTKRGVRFRDFSLALFAHILPGLKFTVQCRLVRATRNVPAKGETSK